MIKCQKMEKNVKDILLNGCYKEGIKTKIYNVMIKKDVHLNHMDYMGTEKFKNLYSERYKN